jgi:hypothetical protein
VNGCEQNADLAVDESGIQLTPVLRPHLSLLLRPLSVPGKRSADSFLHVLSVTGIALEVEGLN